MDWMRTKQGTNEEKRGTHAEDNSCRIYRVVFLGLLSGAPVSTTPLVLEGVAVMQGVAPQYLGRNLCGRLTKLCWREFCRFRDPQTHHGLFESSNASMCRQFDAGISAQPLYRISMASP